MGFIYQRSPRIKPELKPSRHSLPAPPILPGKPRIGLAWMVLSALAVLTGSGILVYVLNLRGVGLESLRPLAWMAGLVIFLAVTAPAVYYWVVRSRFMEAVLQRESDYKELLEGLELEWAREADKQREWLEQIHGDFERSESIVRRRSPSLWERSFHEPDFLHLRIGLGQEPSAFSFTLPEESFNEPEDLRELAKQLVERTRFVSGIPVSVPLSESGVTGIVGDVQSCQQVLRNLLVQMTVRHSPDEVKLSVFFREEGLKQWSWLRWFPHVWDEKGLFRRMAASAEDKQRLADYLQTELRHRFEQSGGNGAGTAASRASVRNLVVLSDPEVIANNLLLAMLTETGKLAGAHTVVLARSVDQLPRQCRLIIECEEEQGSYLWKREDGQVETHTFQLDRISLEESEHLARLMARIQLKNAKAEALPERMGLVKLLEQQEVGANGITGAWNERRLPVSLPVPLGVKAGGKSFFLNFHDRLDLGGQGPHGLIAGTTGSGKSALLQTLIISAAVHYHPHDAAFLLVDYKGGGMSGALKELPHVVGSLTNLDGRLVERAKAALRAELVARQKKLKAAGGLEHIDEYYKLGAPLGPLPHMFVIVDEFSELKQDFPDFIDELVSVASIGRTLGLHLILATQKPAGVVDDKIWSNSRFRICLRVESESDSREMLRIPDAAWLNISGRGLVQIGTEWTEEVQFAWPGALYSQADDPSSLDGGQLFKVRLNGSRQPVGFADTSAVPAAAAENLKPDRTVKKELEVLVTAVKRAAEELNLEPLPGPWLPPLPERLFLEELPETTGEHKTPFTALMGLADDIAGQRQFAAGFSLREGHAVIYGMPGSGKTTLLQTIFMSLALNRANNWHGYFIDMGRMLGDFAELPQVGAVVTPDEGDRMSRLFRFLKRIAAERRELLAAAGIKQADQYRGAFGKTLEDIVLVVDDYRLFQARYPREAEQLDELMREGAAAGITLLVTASRYGDIPEKTRSLIPQAAALELADAGDYYFAVGKSAAEVPSVSGRGYLKGRPPLEFQTALPVKGIDDYERAEQLRMVIGTIAGEWSGAKAPKIPSTPSKVNLRELLPVGRQFGLQPAALPVPIGLDLEELTAAAVELGSGPHFVVSSPMGGGKTTFLQSWILSLAWHADPEQLAVYLIEARAPQPNSPRLSMLADLPHIRAAGHGESGAAEMVSRLEEDIRAERENGKLQPVRLLIIDDADLMARRLNDFAVKDRLTELVRGARDYGLHVVLSGVPGDFPGFGADWIAEVKACQTGFILGTKDPSDLSFMRIPMKESVTEPGELPVLPPGEGYFVNRRYIKVKAAVPFDKVWTPETWVARVCDQWEISV